MPQLPSPLRLATSLDVTTIRDICRPLFDTINSQTSTFVWAGVFGSVSRGTQRDSSEVDILLGYAPNARFFEDVCGDMGILVDQLPEVLGLRVDVIQHVQDRSMGIVQVEALLSAKTIWGNEQWLPPQRDKAESVLRQSYQKLNEAERMMRAVRQRVLRSKDLLILSGITAAIGPAEESFSRDGLHHDPIDVLAPVRLKAPA